MAAADAQSVELELRLRRLAAICAPLAAAVAVAVGAIVWMAERDEVSGWVTSPPGDSFLMALGAMLLILLSSAAHTRLLRRELEPEEAADGEAAAAATPSSSEAARLARTGERLRAFGRATVVSFAMQAVAAALGATVAFRGNAPFYGLVICMAALLAMVARWPRRRRFEMLLAEDDA
jgi:hypothetical protein